MVDESRLSVDDSHGILDITISGRVERWKEGLILGWAILWTLCGIFIVYQLFARNFTREENLVLFVYMVFWVFFEYKSVYAFLWRRYGKEKMRLENGELLYKKDLFGYGKVTRYFMENIRNLNKVSWKKSSYSSVYFRSFWIIGGEKLSFEYQSKTIRFGMQLNDTETSQLLQILKRRIKRRK
jgi:hypothetical protein